MANHRLLLVDNDPDLLAALAELIGSVGFDVVTATTLESAAEELRRRDHSLVLTDWLRAPGAPVWAALAAFTRDAAPTPVGLMTGHRVPAGEAEAHGLRFVLQKPFSLEAVLEQVGAATGQSLADREEGAIRSYFTALSTSDWDGLASLCHEDVEYRLPGEAPQFCTTVRGRSAFRLFSESTFRDFPDAQFEVESLLPLPDGGIARYRATWTGRPEPVVGSVLFRLQDGYIAQIGVRTDVTTLVPTGS